MQNRKIIYLSLLSLLVLVGVFFAIIVFQKNQELKIVFLDVGQGDSILICEGLQQILIDGGKDGKVLLEKIGKYIPFWDRNIETIISTHPDQDHINGLNDIVGAYKVNAVIQTNAKSDSQTYKTLQQEIANKKVQRIEAKKDVKIIFPNGAVAQVLYPFNSLPDVIDQNTNDHSVLIKLTFGQNTFLFTGDLPTTMENELIGKDIDLHADILKVAHHGSKYATSNEFLDAVSPQAAIISVGKNNSYGHPNQEVLQRLVGHKVNALRTDEIGDIVYNCPSANEKCQKMP